MEMTNLPQMQENNEPAAIIGQESLPVTSLWVDIRRRFLSNKLATLGLLTLTAILVLVIGAPLFAQHDPVLDMNLRNRLQPPGAPGHILGTDDYGRDIFARLLYGGRVSL